MTRTLVFAPFVTVTKPDQVPRANVAVFVGKSATRPRSPVALSRAVPVKEVSVAPLMSFAEMLTENGTVLVRFPLLNGAKSK